MTQSQFSTLTQGKGVGLLTLALLLRNSKSQGQKSLLSEANTGLINNDDCLHLKPSLQPISRSFLLRSCRACACCCAVSFFKQQWYEIVLTLVSPTAAHRHISSNNQHRQVWAVFLLVLFGKPQASAKYLFAYKHQRISSACLTFGRFFRNLIFIYMKAQILQIIITKNFFKADTEYPFLKNLIILIF